jgi:hypothetical protein
MTSKILSTRVLPHTLLLLLMMMMRPTSLYSAGTTDDQSEQPTSAGSFTQPATIDVKGTWSGTFFSKHSNVAPFTITVVITPNSKGHLTGNSSFNSDCLKGAKLEVTVTGSTVVLSGSDAEGDNMTVRGTLDNTGTLLTVTYILNGSASGRCETDDGTGTLGKR